MSYDICPAIQLSFNDPLTGLPAAGGNVFFYEDVNRSVLKPVYALSGSPGSYSWVPYTANVDGSISLDSSGSFNPQLYLYPYDEDGNVDKYYIDAYSSTGASIYQTENFPDISPDDASLVYLISTAGISPVNLADQTQVAKAVENYVLSGDFFVDSSEVANIYVAERESPQGFVLPTQLVDGMKVRFIPGTTNTGASTFTIIETTNSIVGSRGSTTALTGGQIVEGQDLWLSYDLANTNWYICPNNADYVSAGNYYADISAGPNAYVFTTPLNPAFSNPSELFIGMKVRGTFAHTNTGPSTLRFLGQTYAILNAYSGQPLSAGQIQAGVSIGNIGVDYELTLTDDGDIFWTLSHVPSSYSPVVIQKVRTFQTGYISATSDYTGNTATTAGQFAVQTFTPKSISSEINFNFNSGGAVGPSPAAIVFGIFVNGVCVGSGSQASSNPISANCTGKYINTTGAALSVGVYYGANGGSGLCYLSSNGTITPTPGSCSLTIEEII